MNFLNIIADLFRPAAELVDNLHTSEEERLAVKSKLFAIQAQLTIEALNYEKEVLKAKASVIQAEAQGQSWLQRSWRPITMLTFLVLVVCDAFGLLAFRLSDQAWLLLQIGLGGYVVGRSVEKIAPKVAEVTRKD